LAEVGSGLKVLHENKIIHRDLKLENVFLFNKTHCKIGDFSISKELEWTFLQASTQSGTPFCMVWMIVVDCGCFIFFYVGDTSHQK
jgi:NIMA (never in mitosis gene a)-related kinase